MKDAFIVIIIMFEIMFAIDDDYLFNIDLESIRVPSNISDETALKLWNDYINIFDEFLAPPKETFMQSIYLEKVREWNNTIYDIYNQTGKLPRLKHHYRPGWLYYTLHKRPDHVLDLAAEDLEERPYQLGRSVIDAAVEHLYDIFWRVVLLERFLITSTKIRSSMVRSMRQWLKKVIGMQYNTRVLVDAKFAEISRPKGYVESREKFKNIIDVPQEIPLSAGDFWEEFPENFINICPIINNHVCNTLIELKKSEGAPCWCAIVNPDEINVKQTFLPKKECLLNAKLLRNQKYASLTINSTLPTNLVPGHNFGSEFLELLVLSMVNATKLPGRFDSKKLKRNPLISFRVHCSDDWTTATIQFLLVARVLTEIPNEEIKPRPDEQFLFLNPFRMWDEMVSQSVIDNVTAMGVNVIDYGVIQELAPVHKLDQPYVVVYINRSGDSMDCRLPETNSTWKILNHVILFSDCDLFYMSFWNQFLIGLSITMFFWLLGGTVFFIWSRTYRWMISFGYFKRFSTILETSEKQNNIES